MKSGDESAGLVAGMDIMEPTIVSVSTGWTGKAANGKTVTIRIEVGLDDLVRILAATGATASPDTVPYRTAYRVLRMESRRRLLVEVARQLGHEPDPVELHELHTAICQILAEIPPARSLAA